MNILVSALSLCNDRDLDPLVEIRGRKILIPPLLFCATVSFDDQESCPSLCLPSPSLLPLHILSCTAALGQTLGFQATGRNVCTGGCGEGRGGGWSLLGKRTVPR